MKLYGYQNEKLADLILNFVSEEVKPAELYTQEDLVAYVRVNLSPEDVFSNAVLGDWARDRGFRKFE
jgi:hypothetical protein